MAAIEVEKKFVLTAEEEQKLLASARLLADKKIVDAYYDTSDFRLTTSDHWLRKRDGAFELKVPIRGTSENTYGMDRYRELTEEEDIRRTLGVPRKRTLAEDLAAHGYEPYARYVTVRRKYQKGPFTIDLDETNFGFREVEIEMMVENEQEVSEATGRIIAFAREHGLDLSPLDGKTIEYIREHNPAHYTALLKAGVLRAKGQGKKLSKGEQHD